MEKWKEYYSEEQLKKLQEIEKQNLKVFVEFCKKYNLQYFLYGGTLLGAVKYGGMIPWDDDIDVAMPREDYYKFIKLADSALPDGYFIQNPYNCPKCPYPYTKLRRKGTKFVEYINRNLDIETGIYIDIYPVDKIPDDEKLRLKQFKNVRKWILIYVIRQSKLYQKQESSIIGNIKNILKFFLSMLLKLLPRTYCLNQIDHYMTEYNDKDYKRYAALNSPNIENIYLQLYPLEKIKFEGMEFFAPGDYSTHLRMRYGDYSKDLEEEKRFGHIPYIISFETYKN